MPESAATCNAVPPFDLIASGSARARQSVVRIAACPISAARCSDVALDQPCSLPTSAPAASSASTASACPIDAAIISAVTPASPTASKSDPVCASTVIAAGWFVAAAACKAVVPSGARPLA
eukprot:scaffold227668_cov27-Tisochrysis_lutea.AAC.2